MNTKTLKDLFLAELADTYDAEKRLTKALPKMAKAATSAELRKAIETHQKQTLGHVTRLEQVFQSFDLAPKGKTCEATRGLIEESDALLAEFKGSPTLNAAIIAATQKVEHYEMASYGCLREWAGLLGNRKAAGLLDQTLAEERSANEALIQLARAGSNDEALGHGREDAPSGKQPGLAGLPRPALRRRPAAVSA